MRPVSGQSGLLMALLSAASLAQGAEVIVDNSDSGFSVLSQTWSVTSLSGQYGADYRYKLTDDSPAGEVEWRPSLIHAGTYQVLVWYRSTGTGRPSNAKYTVHAYTGNTDVFVNQQINGSQWVSLGSFSFAAGTTGSVSLTSQAEAGKTIVADAMRFVDECAGQYLTDFEAYADNAVVMFNLPRVSGSTSANLTTSPNIAAVTHIVQGDIGPACYMLNWQFVDTALTRWLRATSFGVANLPNPTISLDRPVRVRLRLDGPAGASLLVSLGVRETGTTAAIGADGGTANNIEWVGASSTVSSAPQGKPISALSGVWQTLVFDPLRDSILAFTGNGVLSSSSGKGTIEHLAFSSTGQAGPFTVYIDGVEEMCDSPPSQPFDFDYDGDVDADDFTVFDACQKGADIGPPLLACRKADLDVDNDVDQLDFAYLQLCLSGTNVPALPFCATGATTIPPRPANAITGSAFKNQVLNLAISTREQMVLTEMTSGNIPDFLRTFVPVTVSATIGGTLHTGTFYVMPDVLSIGSNADYFRMPMGPRTAQSIGDAFGCIMPTRKMVGSIWSATTYKLAPVPFSPATYDIQSVDVFWQSHQAIENERISAGAPVGANLGGTKKDVVITAQLASNPGKVAIYGWYQTNGSPIQPLYLGHEITYMDYSHGIHLIKQVMIVDGQQRLVTDILADPTLNALISDEGVVNDPRYH